MSRTELDYSENTVVVVRHSLIISIIVRES